MTERKYEPVRRDFERHWRANASQQVADRKLEVAGEFFRPIVEMLRSQPLTVLDVGCGDGAHWRYLRGLGNAELNYTGVDISAAVIDRMRRRENLTGKDRFVQADATALSEVSDSYDVVFSFGAVAYTTDPRRCLAELRRVCKPAGWIGVWIYPRLKGLGGLAFGLTRKVCQQAGSFWTRRIADMIVPFLGILRTRSGMNLLNSTWQQCREVVLVNIAPKQLAFFSREEIVAWFAANGVDIKYEDPTNPITIWGQKR